MEGVGELKGPMPGDRIKPVRWPRFTICEVLPARWAGSYILDGTSEMPDDSNGQAGALTDEPEVTEEMIAAGGALLYMLLDDAEGGAPVGKYSAQTIAKRVYEVMAGRRDRRKTHQHAPAIDVGHKFTEGELANLVAGLCEEIPFSSGLKGLYPTGGNSVFAPVFPEGVDLVGPSCKVRVEARQRRLQPLPMCERVADERVQTIAVGLW